MSDLIQLGLNHEQQHQELILTDVKYGLATNPLRPAYRDSAESDEARTILLPPCAGSHFLRACIRSASQEMALRSTTRARGITSIWHPFRLASRLVTNGEYLEFMRDNGYGTATLWLSDGWDAVRANEWSSPLYWQLRDGQWWHYTMDGMKPVRPKSRFVI